MKEQVIGSVIEFDVIGERSHDFWAGCLERMKAWIVFPNRAEAFSK
jgi:hypothetical protein